MILPACVPLGRPLRVSEPVAPSSRAPQSMHLSATLQGAEPNSLRSRFRLYNRIKYNLGQVFQLLAIQALAFFFFLPWTHLLYTILNIFFKLNN